MGTNIKRIGISGSHSCGKTTLFHELTKYLPEYPTIEETAGLFPRSTRSRMETQRDIMKTQCERERRCYPLMLSDRVTMDNIAYMNLCYNEGTRTPYNTMLRNHILKMYDNHMMTHPYDLIIFVDELLEIEDNGSRCLNPYYQTLIYDDLKLIVNRAHKTFGNFDIMYVKGSTGERVESILKYLAKQ